jgi:2'-5' RNA ligase
MRTFISINLSEETKRKIFEIQNEIKFHFDDDTKYSIRWEDSDKFHITLFFLGDVIDKQVDIIKNELSLINEDKIYKVINFKNKSINAFPNLKNPRVLIIDLENEDRQIYRLYEEIYSALGKCGFEPDKKFHPHITLGRVKRDRNIKLKNLEQLNIPVLEFNVNEFYFMESKIDSTGSTYKTLKRFDLH